MGEVTGVLNVVLLGKTGAGKSLSGNTILGRQAFISKKSSTTVTLDVAVESGAVEGFSVTVYDTPGLSDIDISEEQIEQMIKIKVLQKCASGLCVFLLVIKADRFTEEERKTVEKIEKILGEKQLKNTWILFTRGDELEGENMTIQEFIDETKALKTLVQKYEHRYHLFNNKNGSIEQVKILFTKIKTNNDTMAMGAAKPSIRIVLLGEHHVGKSASGNTILGQNEFRSGMMIRPVTCGCSEAQATVSGRSVSVVDTPGLFDTYRNPEQLMMEISRSVCLFSPGPHAFLIVFTLYKRFTEQELQIPQMMEKMFGKEVLKYSIILFTYGDLLDGEFVEMLIEENSGLRSLVQQCGGRYQLFNNEDVNNREQVEDLLQKIDSMIQQNVGGHYTNQMYEEQRQREVIMSRRMGAYIGLSHSISFTPPEEMGRLIPRLSRLRLMEQSQSRRKEERQTQMLTLRLIERIREEAELTLRMIEQLRDRQEERDLLPGSFDSFFCLRATMTSRERRWRMMEEEEEIERLTSRERRWRMMEEEEEIERLTSRERRSRMMEEVRREEEAAIERLTSGETMMEEMREKEEMESLRSKLRTRCSRMRLIERVREEGELTLGLTRQLGDRGEESERLRQTPSQTGQLREEAELTLKMIEQLRVREKEESAIDELKLTSRERRQRLRERLREEMERRRTIGVLLPGMQPIIGRERQRLIEQMREEREMERQRLIEQMREKEKMERRRSMERRWREKGEEMESFRSIQRRLSLRVQLREEEEEMQRQSSIERRLRLIEQVRQKVELTLRLITQLRDMEEEERMTCVCS